MFKYAILGTHIGYLGCLGCASCVCVCVCVCVVILRNVQVRCPRYTHRLSGLSRVC